MGTDTGMNGSRRFDRFDRWFLGVSLALWALVYLVTLSDYGIGWDSCEYYVGDKNLRFITSLNPAHLDYRKDTIPAYHGPGHPDFYRVYVELYDSPVRRVPHEIWPLGGLCSSISKHVFHGLFGLDPFDAHHLFLLPVGLGLLLTVYAFARLEYGRWAAVTAFLLLALHPRLLAHLHFNFKDPPAVLLLALSIFLFYRGVDRRPWWLLASAVCWGLGLATKSYALVQPLILIPWFVVVLYSRRRRAAALLPKREAQLLAAYPLIGLAVMLLVWPWLWVDFPQHLVDYARSVLTRSRGGDGLPAGAWPWLNLLAANPIMLLLPAAGGAAILSRRARRERELPRDLLLYALWILVPLLRVSLPNSVDFDVLRQRLHVLVPLALLAGIAAQTALEHKLIVRLTGEPARLTALRLGLLGVLLLPLLWWNVQNHPNQLCFYNAAVGGVGGARRYGFPSPTDYWGQSYRQGCRWLNDKAEPNAVLVVGVAEHIVVTTASTWLRSDIRILSGKDRGKQDLQALANEYQVPVYFMTVTRQDQYVAAIAELQSSAAPVHEITVDGGPILQIFRLTPR